MVRGLIGLIMAGAAASAGATTIVNGSFETPNLGSGNFSYDTQPDGWTGNGALVNAQGSSPWYGSTAPAGAEGSQFYALQGNSTLSQTFTATSQGAIGINWLQAGRPDFGSYAGNQSYTVSLRGNGFSATRTFSTTSGSAFAPVSFNANLTRGGTYTLTLTGLATTDQTAFLDGFSASAVPEPATWAMMILGFGLVGVAMRRRAALTA